jgi:hypothetical protein
LIAHSVAAFGWIAKVRETKTAPRGFERPTWFTLFAGLRACQLVASLSKSRNKSKELDPGAGVHHGANVFGVQPNCNMSVAALCLRLHPGREFPQPGHHILIDLELQPGNCASHAFLSEQCEEGTG